MEDNTNKELDSGINTISERLSIDPSLKEDYEQFLARQRTQIPPQTDNTDAYFKKLDHVATLSFYGKTITGILRDSEENRNSSFAHQATNVEGVVVGYELTHISKDEEGHKKVVAEFIGTGLDNKDPLTAEKLLKARHSELRKEGITKYNLGMLKRSANILMHRGYKLTLIDDDDDEAGYYEIDIS